MMLQICFDINASLVYGDDLPRDYTQQPCIYLAVPKTVYFTKNMIYPVALSKKLYIWNNNEDNITRRDRPVDHDMVCTQSTFLSCQNRVKRNMPRFIQELQLEDETLRITKRNRFFKAPIDKGWYIFDEFFKAVWIIICMYYKIPWHDSQKENAFASSGVQNVLTTQQRPSRVMGKCDLTQSQGLLFYHYSPPPPISEIVLIFRSALHTLSPSTIPC
jgi:hypothetical protein